MRRLRRILLDVGILFTPIDKSFSARLLGWGKRGDWGNVRFDPQIHELCTLPQICQKQDIVFLKSSLHIKQHTVGFQIMHVLKILWYELWVQKKRFAYAEFYFKEQSCTLILCVLVHGRFVQECIDNRHSTLITGEIACWKRAKVCGCDVCDYHSIVGIWANAKGDVVNRGMIHGDRQSYKTGGEDENTRNLHFMCNSPNDVDIVVRLCNASDLTDKGAAAVALADAFIHLTGHQSPMTYHRCSAWKMGR